MKNYLFIYFLYLVTDKQKIWLKMANILSDTRDLTLLKITSSQVKNYLENQYDRGNNCIKSSFFLIMGVNKIPSFSQKFTGVKRWNFKLNLT